jgi:hypothetical protein
MWRRVALYEGGSVNWSEMDIRRKTCYIRTWEKHLFLDISPTDIVRLVPSLYHCVETHSIEAFWVLFHPPPHLRFNLSEMFSTQLSFLYEYPLHWVLLPTKTYIGTLIFGNILLEHGLHFDFSNQSLNIRMRVWYLDCHEVGLCCYLAIQIENLLRPLQLLYFHLWPIYWLSLVFTIWSADVECRQI